MHADVSDASVPVNFRKQSAAPAEILEAAEYAVRVAQGYFEQFRESVLQGADRGSLNGLRVLEIGPGPTLGTAVLLAGAGARVTVADRFLPDWDDDFHLAFFDALRMRVGPADDRTRRTIANVLDARSFEAAVECRPLGAEQLASLGGTFDVIYSNAVLEHVEDLDRTAASIARVTAPGGFGFHQVDLRDHRDFSRPLEFLTLPRAEFETLRAACHCECGAWWRASDVARAFEGAGLEVESRPNMFAAPEYLTGVRPRLVPEFGSRTDEDLAVISGLFVMRRPS